MSEAERERRHRELRLILLAQMVFEARVEEWVWRELEGLKNEEN